MFFGLVLLEALSCVCCKINIKTHIFYTILQQLKAIGFLKEIPRLICSASTLNKYLSESGSSIIPSLHFKNTPVPPLQREQDVPIFRPFKLSIHNCMDCYQFIQAFICFLFHPLSCFSLTGQLVALYHLNVSLHRMYKPFLATTSSPASQERLASTPSQSVLIFTRLGNTGRCQPWGDFFVLLGGEPTLVQD